MRWEPHSAPAKLKWWMAQTPQSGDDCMPILCHGVGATGTVRLQT